MLKILNVDNEKFKLLEKRRRKKGQLEIQTCKNDFFLKYRKVEKRNIEKQKYRKEELQKCRKVKNYKCRTVEKYKCRNV